MALKVEGGDHESGKAAASRSWESSSVYSQQENGPQSYNQMELNPANNPNKREIDSPLQPPERNTAYQHFGGSSLKKQGRERELN